MTTEFMRYLAQIQKDRMHLGNNGTELTQVGQSSNFRQKSSSEVVESQFQTFHISKQGNFSRNESSHTGSSNTEITEIPQQSKVRRNTSVQQVLGHGQDFKRIHTSNFGWDTSRERVGRNTEVLELLEVTQFRRDLLIKEVKKSEKELEEEIRRIYRIMHYPSQKIGEALGVEVESPFLDEEVMELYLLNPIENAVQDCAT